MLRLLWMILLPNVLWASVNLNQLEHQIDSRLVTPQFAESRQQSNEIQTQMVHQHLRTSPSTNIKLAPTPNCGI